MKRFRIEIPVERCKILEIEAPTKSEAHNIALDYLSTAGLDPSEQIVRDENDPPDRLPLSFDTDKWEITDITPPTKQEMKAYRVDISRTYAVEITARDEAAAKHLAEFYLGTPSDSGTDAQRASNHYKIGNIELINNEAIYAEEMN